MHPTALLRRTADDDDEAAGTSPRDQQQCHHRRPAHSHRLRIGGGRRVALVVRRMSMCVEKLYRFEEQAGGWCRAWFRQI